MPSAKAFGVLLWGFLCRCGFASTTAVTLCMSQREVEVLNKTAERAAQQWEAAKKRLDDEIAKAQYAVQPAVLVVLGSSKAQPNPSLHAALSALTAIVAGCSRLRA